MYRIGEFSRLTQIPVKTLRYYDEIGLLRPARVERSTGYRYYTAAEVERLNRVLVFRDLGFPLRQIRMLVAENVPSGQIRGMLRTRHDELERTVDRERARLARAAARLELIERSGHTAAHEVAVRETGPRLVASVRDTLRSYEDCDGLFDEIAREVGPQRHRGALWHACAGGDRAIDCEAFVFLPARTRASGRVRVHELPGQLMASLVYRGEDEYAPAYTAMRTWLRVTGAGVAGPKRELFLGSGDDGRTVTEIQFPIAPREGATTSEGLPA
ncbi:MAG TPA: MerR family transcriptional regulator [Vicinamibacteria bacterium]|nr:MerR family transcriptional regulator [Vicinamibacteria bacterium]